MKDSQDTGSVSPTGDSRYYYREGMPLRPPQMTLTDVPALGYMRHKLFDKWRHVRDAWSFGTEQTRLLDDHMWQSDELMDRVVDMFKREGARVSPGEVRHGSRKGHRCRRGSPAGAHRPLRVC
jgi:hypothetical protein